MEKDELTPPEADSKDLAASSEKGRRRLNVPMVIGFVAVFVPCYLLASLRIVRFDRRPTRQPIEFNHEKHVKQAALSCDSCHTSYEKETYSGLPTVEDCAFCHTEPQGKGEEERLLAERIRRGERIEWKRLFVQPPHVFFSHRRHVVAGKLSCPGCHGDIGDTTSPPRYVKKLRMEDCIDCHRESQVAVACTTCHR